MMITYILCEGRTDSHLVGFYLESVKNYSYNSKPKLTIENEENKNIINLKNEKEDQITILSTGGKTKIKNNLKEIIERNHFERDEEKIIRNVIVIIDRDSDNDSELINYIDNRIKNINKWNKIKIENQLFGEININIFPLSIPLEEPGALEKFVINSLKKSNSENDKMVINKLDELIDKLKNVDYLQKNNNSNDTSNERYREKAKLGCYLSIYSPDWSLDEITKKIKQIEWTKLKNINSIYEEIIQEL